MLRHQFGQNLILRLDLLLQIRDSFLFGLMVRTSSLLEKGQIRGMGAACCARPQNKIEQQIFCAT